MPGRYISDTVQHCITVTKRIRVPRFMPWRFFPVTSYPPVFGTLSTHVFRYGDPVVPGVHGLSKATLMAEEKPYVYHLLPASQHIGGAVLKAAAGPDSAAEYTIDLGGEPAPVYSYLHLHPDTALAIQGLSVTVNHSPGVMVEARIRQYSAAGQSSFSTPQDWQVVPDGQPYALDFSIDHAAIAAGGPTMLEYRSTYLGGGAFASATEVVYKATLVTASIYETRDVLVTVCDEKDNYRFAFNGQEKVNEVNGIGNHNTALFWEYDTRLGRRWNLDPKPIPSESEYATNRNNPIQNNDPLGDCPHGDGCTCGQAEPSPAGILYEAYLGLDAAIFNTMERIVEWTGNGKPGVSIRKETEYTEGGGIIGNKIVERPKNKPLREAAETVLDLVSLIPGKPTTQGLKGPLLLSKPIITKQNAVQLVKFIQGKGEKAKEVIVALPKGFKEVTSNGKAKVYSDGKKFISPDLDGHNGGIWKMADKEKNLWKKETRTGTYNNDLSKKVGD